MTEQWLSIVEYARTFHISDMTVRRRIKTGKLRAVLKDGKYYIPVSDGGRSEQTTRQEASTPYSEKPTSSRSSDGLIVKDHPAADRTYQTHTPPAAERSAQAYAMPTRIENSQPQQSVSNTTYTYLPSSLARAVESERHASVEAKALLAFCEAALKKAADAERRQSEKFKAKLIALETEVENKNLTIQKLQQQVEDLQVLAKILEKKR